MEDSWARELRAGHKVFVDIEPVYKSASQRPYQLNVTWEVDGQRPAKDSAMKRKVKPWQKISWIFLDRC